MRPTSCPKCEVVFLDSPMMMYEARHLAKVYGSEAAHAWVDEQLDDDHAAHESRARDRSETS